jgi:hypothetical protein
MNLKTAFISGGFWKMSYIIVGIIINYTYSNPEAMTAGIWF